MLFFLSNESLTRVTFVVAKIGEDLMPSPAVLTTLNLLSKVMPKAKLFPKRDLTELSYRDPSKRKLVGFSLTIMLLFYLKSLSACQMTTFQ